MKKKVYLLFAVALLTVAGCAQKTESEKLADQLKTSGKELEKDSMKVVDSPVNEGNKTMDQVKKSIESVQLPKISQLPKSADTAFTQIKKDQETIRFIKEAKATAARVKQETDVAQNR